MALKHAEPGEAVNLLAARSEGSRTAALVKTDRFEAVHLVVPAGSVIPAHAVDGYISLYCIDGDVVLEADREVRMRGGDWVYLERGEKHALSAITDTFLLLTILFDRSGSATG